MALADYQALVPQILRDESGRLSSDDIDDAIAMAVERYSQDRPRPVVEDLADVSGNLLDLPAAWESDFSAVTSLEHPVGEIPPRYLAADRWGLYRSPTGDQIMVLDGLAAGSTVRAAYTARHQLAEAADTVPAQHREALGKLAAALCAEQLANLYANEQDSTIRADVAPGQTKSQAWAARAKALRQAYLDALGTQAQQPRPASAVATMRPTAADGRPQLFHPPRRVL